jgi:hypothetical protein
MDSVAQFKDQAGRIYKIEFDINTAIRIKKATGLPFESMFDARQAGEWDRVNTFLAVKAAVDPENEEAFDRVMSHPETAEKAEEALGEAAADFLPRTQRSLALSMISAGKTIRESRDTAMPEAIAKGLAAHRKSIEKMLSSGRSSGGQDSPESTPRNSDSET